MPFDPLSAIGTIAGLADSVIKRVLPEKISEKDRLTLTNELTLELMKEDNQRLLGQLQINLEEAKSSRIFVSGWRPFCGWVCGGAFAYSFILQPFLAFGYAMFAAKLPPLPTLDSGALMTILLGLLGLGGMRSFDKAKGTS